MNYLEDSYLNIHQNHKVKDYNSQIKYWIPNKYFNQLLH